MGVALDRPAARRLGQRPHVGGAAKSNSRAIDDPPAGLVDLDCAPLGVGEVEIKLAVEMRRRG